MRGVVPNGMTAARIPLGAAAVVAAADGHLERAATLITLGAVTDGLDGWAARRLDAITAFGALFDYFCDYLCFVVAPWMLTRALLASEPSAVRDVLLALPLLTAAIRYTRNGLIAQAAGADAPPLPGLGTVFFAFLSVTAVFLDAPRLIDRQLFAWIMTTVVVLFSVMMVSPITYPKLVAFRGASPLVIVLLACMPFLATRILAAVLLLGGLLYALVAPLLVARPPVRLQ